MSVLDWHAFIIGLGMMVAGAIGYFSYYSMYAIGEEDKEGNALPWNKWSIGGKIISLEGLVAPIGLFLFSFLVILGVILEVFRLYANAITIFVYFLMLIANVAILTYLNKNKPRMFPETRLGKLAFSIILFAIGAGLSLTLLTLIMDYVS